MTEPSGYETVVESSAGSGFGVGIYRRVSEDGSSELHVGRFNRRGERVRAETMDGAIELAVGMMMVRIAP